MARVKANIGEEKYKVEIKSSNGNTLLADEPAGSGGKNAGFSPKELLASSLAACTSITLTMYAERKSWPLKGVEVNVNVLYDKERNETRIDRNIIVSGELDEDQKQSLLAIANKCPLHKILTSSIKIESAIT